MRILEILRRKGADVVTIAPQASVRELVAVLTEHNIGAVVVCTGGMVAGIASERDVVRQLHREGPALLDRPVADIMTAAVHTCAPSDHVDSLRVTMTEHRIRHLPVVRAGNLVGIVSIGDVVKSAISELQDEREHLVAYLQS